MVTWRPLGRRLKHLDLKCNSTTIKKKAKEGEIKGYAKKNEIWTMDLFFNTRVQHKNALCPGMVKLVDFPF